MTEHSNGPSPRSGKAFKWLALGGGTLVLLLIAGYFVATSSGFLKAVVLPRVGDAIGAKIEADEIALSPFSEIIIRGLKVRTTGAEPVLSTDRVRAVYDLRAILGGTIKISEATVESAKVVVEENPDGTSNLTPLLKSTQAGAAKPAGASKPPVLDIGMVKLAKADLTYIKRMTNGASDQFAVKGLDIQTGPIRNGQPITVELGAFVSMQQSPATPGTPPASLNAEVKGKLEAGLDAEMRPTSLKATPISLNIREAGGSMAELKGLQAEVGLDWTPAEIKQLMMRFSRAGQGLGEILAQGPFKTFQQEGKLNLIVRGIGPDVVKLATAASGIDLGKVSLGTTNVVELADGARSIAITGTLAGSQLKVTHPQFKTPTLDFQVKYEARIDQAKKQASVQTLELSATQDAAPVALVTLAQPMMLDWGAGGGAPAESSLQVKLSSLRIVDWLPVVTTNSPNGVVHLDLALQSRQAGKEIAYQASLRAVDLVALIPGRPAPPAALTVNAVGSVKNFSAVALTKLNVQFAAASQTALSMTGTASYDVKTQAAALDADLESTLGRLSPWIPIEGLEYRDGVTRVKVYAEQGASIAQGTNAPAPKRAIKIEGGADKLHARFQNIVIDGWSKQGVLEAEMEGDVVVLKRAQSQIRAPGSTVPAIIQAEGRFNVKSGAGSANVSFSKVAQEMLRPFLQGTGFGSNLISAELNGRAMVQLDPKAASTYSGQIAVTNFVVKPREGKPSAPLALATVFDASSTGAVHQLKSLRIGLGQTARAPRNEIEIQGRFDLTQTNKIQGKIELIGEAVDVTSWHAAFAGAPPATPDAPEKVESKASTVEPKAVQTPLQSMQWNLQLGTFFIGDVGWSNLVCQGEINASKVAIRPVRFVMNKITNECSADIDLGVDGYAYNVMLNAPRVPLEPFVNTFVPAFRGQLQGELIAQGAIKGAGVTGVNLRRSLDGRLAAHVTNANMHIVGPRAKMILTPIAIALRLSDLLKSPLQGFDLTTEFGQGQIRVKQLAVLSEMFRAESAGVIPIADDLNQSRLQLPVDFSLTRSAAQRSNLLPANTPTNQAFVALPRFATIKGTIGTPSTDIDKLVISGMLLKSVVGIPGAVGEKAGGILEGIGNLLTRPATPQVPAVNPPSLTPPAVPATPVPAQPQRPNPLQLPLNLLDAARKPVPAPQAPAAPAVPAPVPNAAPKPAATPPAVPATAPKPNPAPVPKP